MALNPQYPQPLPAGYPSLNQVVLRQESLTRLVDGSRAWKQAQKDPVNAFATNTSLGFDRLQWVEVDPATNFLIRAIDSTTTPIALAQREAKSGDAWVEVQYPGEDQVFEMPVRGGMVDLALGADPVKNPALAALLGKTVDIWTDPVTRLQFIDTSAAVKKGRFQIEKDQNTFSLRMMGMKNYLFVRFRVAHNKTILS